MLMFEPLVRVNVWSDALSVPLLHASIWGLKTGKTIVVFSIDDRTHNPGSLHPFDLAMDLDVAGNSDSDLKELYAWLRRWLPPGFDVVFEQSHVHVEYDQKRPDALAAPAK